MLSKIFNTLRVVVEGAKTPEDEKLIPSDLFPNTFNFDDAVAQLFELQDATMLAEFIKLCISIDTLSIPIIHDDDPEPADEILYLLNNLSEIFAFTEGTYGIKVMDGTVNADPHYSGLSGRFIQLYTDFIGDPDSRMYSLISILKTICADNPSTTETWWLTTLTNIYTHHQTDGDDDVLSWFDDDDAENGSSSIVQLWYLRINPQLHRLVSLYSDVYQNDSPNSLIFKVIDEYKTAITTVAELYSGEGVICEKAPELIEAPSTTIEDALFNLLLAIDEV